MIQIQAATRHPHVKYCTCCGGEAFMIVSMGTKLVCNTTVMCAGCIVTLKVIIETALDNPEEFNVNNQNSSNT